MATYTLAQLKEDVSKKYEPTTIENGDDVYVLPNFFQMSSPQRKEITDILDALDSDDDDDEGTDNLDVEVHYEAILKAAVQDNKGEELLELLGDNLALKTEIVNSWLESVQAGEA